MSNINRDYLIILDVKSGEVDSPNIYYFNTDKNTSNLYVQMVIKETSIEATPIDNATDYSIKANILKPNMVGKIVEGNLVNEAKAIYEFKLPADCTDFSGNAKIEFEVYCTVDGVEEIATSFATKFKVYGSVLTEQNKYIEDSSDYPILKELIEEVRELQANGGGGTGTGTSGHTHSNKSVLDGITSTRVTHWDTAYNHSQSHHFSGDYNDLTNKPTIPTKTSQLTNDSGYITNIPDEYITETELTAKGYATTSQIPTVPTNVSAFTNDANYASEIFVSNKIAEAQLGGTSIDDTTTATNKTWSSSKIDSQIKETAKKTSVENGKLYLLKEDGTKIDTGTTLPTNSNSSSSIQTYITEDVGELFSAPSNYIAWCPSNLIYDKTIDKYIGIINCADAHAYTSLTRYLIKIDPNNLVIEEIFSIEDKIKDSSGSSLTLTTNYNTISSLILLNDNSYMFIADLSDGKHRFISTDNGNTWLESGTVTGINYHHWATYKMSDGRLISSYDYKKQGIIYSDDNGSTWTQVIPATCGGGYEAEVCILELSQNNLMAIGRYSSSGIGYNERGDSEHAIISYSTDNGTTWTPWQISTSIDNMNAASCCGIVHDGIVEIFTTSRWWKNGDNSTTDYDNTGKQGAMIHYTATIENALNDNFTRKGIIDYARGDAQEYHAPSIAIDNNKNILIMHMDKGSVATCTQRFIRGSLDNLSYLAKDGSKSQAKAYSAKYTETLFANMLEKINYLQYMVSQIEGSGVDVPTGTLIWTLPLIAEENTSTTFPALLTSKSINYTTSYVDNPAIHPVPATDDNGDTYWSLGTVIKIEFPVTKENYATEFEFITSNLAGFSLIEKNGSTASGISYWGDTFYVQGLSPDVKTKIKIIRNGGIIELYINDTKTNLVPSGDISGISNRLYNTSLEKCILVSINGGKLYNLKFGEWDS